MHRQALLALLKDRAPWDILVIGGGATGLGVAVEAASRGYRTLLMEQKDFAQGTSSRSTKLVHGGVRYLQQGNLALVLEALHERGLLIKNAPHLVHHQAFIVPNYEWWEGPFYGIGLKIYDMLAGRLGLEASRQLTRAQTLKRIPTLEPERLRGGAIYYDGQFDDARLAVTLAQTVWDLGGCALNYLKMVALDKQSGLITGVVAQDQESGREYHLRARVVINAAGPFVDLIRKLDDPAAPAIIAPSQGVHLVLDKSFLASANAVMVPHTDDGRIIFAVPWHRRVIIGTTDTPVAQPTLEPQAMPQEIEFLLSHTARYLTKDPRPENVLSVYAGLRPLIGTTHAASSTAAMARDHHLMVSDSGLITIAGGKWTTYRKMGQDTVDKALMIGGLPKRPSQTEKLHLHGWVQKAAASDPLGVYGSDAPAIRALAQSDSSLGQHLHPRLPYQQAQVVWAVRHEMARTVEDVLARRTRALILDARASAEMAPRVAALMAAELGFSRYWQAQQTAAFQTLTRNYILT